MASATDSIRRVLIGLGLLGSAFAPLAALITALQWEQMGWLRWPICVVCIATVVLLVAVIRATRSAYPDTIQAEQVRACDEQVLAFASGYVVPVLVAGFAEDDRITLYASGALVVLLATIYVRGQLYHLNPTLAVFGFRLYQVTAVNGTVTMLLSHQRRIAQDATLTCWSVGDHAAIE
jgi:hypothetical protein